MIAIPQHVCVFLLSSLLNVPVLCSGALWSARSQRACLLTCFERKVRCSYRASVSIYLFFVRHLFKWVLSSSAPDVWGNKQDEHGAYLIDRSPEYFEPILNYLRHGQLIINEGINIRGKLSDES